MKLLPLFEVTNILELNGQGGDDQLEERINTVLCRLARDADKENNQGDMPLTEFCIDICGAFGINDKTTDEWLNSGATSLRLIKNCWENTRKNTQSIRKALIKLAANHEHGDDIAKYKITEL